MPAAAHRALRRLRAALVGTAQPFACGGSIPFTQPITLRAEGTPPIKLSPIPTDGFVGDVVRAEKAAARFAAEAAKRCEPAPFGFDTETLVDPSVRDALQLRAHGDTLRIEGLDEAVSVALEETRGRLLPDDPNPLRAELYALNVYRQKGHFVRHKDTPRGADMIGTLVVNLPTEYSGGALCLARDGEEVRFFERRFRDREHASRLEWAAFFGDVDHEVRPVTSGARVTLTWVLRRSGGLPPRGAVTGSVRARFADALSEAVQDETFLPDGGRIAVPCVHLYSQSRTSPTPHVTLTAETALALKARDQSVALAALDAGLEVKLEAVLAESCADQEWTLKRFLLANEESLFKRHQVDDSDIEDRLPVAQTPDQRSPPDEWVVPPPTLEPTRAQKTFGDSPALRHLGCIEYSSTGYFGNEGGETDFYAYAVVEIVVPPARRRKRRENR